MRSVHLSFLRIALAAVLLAWLSHTRADPDLWGHVVFGESIISERSVARADPYSFMSDRPWINHEWLSECVIYLAYAAGGAAGLVGLKVTLLVGMLAAVAVALGRRSVKGTSRDLLLALAVLGAFGQINHIRPQIFSVAAFAWLLLLLTDAPARGLSRLFLLPILFAVWVNLHGGWIVGAATLALWTACSLVTKGPRSEKIQLTACTVLSLLATLLNPYGWRMWAFLWNTVGFGRAEITEWQPVFRVGTTFAVVWSVLALAAVAGITHSVRTSENRIRRIAVAVMLGVASFWVTRLMAFFAISTVVLFGQELLSVIERFGRRNERRSHEPGRLAVAAALGIACILIGGGGVVSARNVGCVRMDSPRLPEAQVVEFAARNGLRGRLVVWFDWGEYAIWHLGPSLSVSVDGRRETVYSEDVLNRHLRFYFVPSTREQFLNEVHPDYIWLPSDLPVVTSLLSDGWIALVTGPQSVLLGRSGERGAALAGEAVDRCFPGP